MIPMLLAAVLLANSETWLMFDVCMVDFSQRPPVASRSRDHAIFALRANAVQAVSEIRPKPVGINCALIGGPAGQKIYVIGTLKEILRKLGK